MHTQEWFTNGSEREGRESEVKKRNVHSPLPSGQTLFPETHSGMDRGFGASGGVKPRSIFLVSRKLCTAAARHQKLRRPHHLLFSVNIIIAPFLPARRLRFFSQQNMIKIYCTEVMNPNCSQNK